MIERNRADPENFLICCKEGKAPARHVFSPIVKWLQDLVSTVAQ